MRRTKMEKDKKLEGMWELTADVIIAGLQNPETATQIGRAHV